MRDILQRCLAIVGMIVVVYFSLHVLRFVALPAETRGVCAGIVGYIVGDCLAGPRYRRKR